MSGCPGLVGNDGSAARSTHCSTPNEQLEQRGVDQDRGDVGKSEHEGRPREEERVTRGDVANQVERDAGNDERRQGSNEREDAKNRQHQFHGLSEVRCWKNEARGQGQHDGCIDPRWPADAHAISFADDVGCQRRVVANCLTLSPLGGISGRCSTPAAGRSEQFDGAGGAGRMGKAPVASEQRRIQRLGQGDVGGVVGGHVVPQLPTAW